MNPRSIITIIILLAIIGTIWFLVSAKPRYKDRMLQAQLASLVRQMKSNDISVRVQAVSAMRRMGTSFTASDSGLTALYAALNDPDDDVRTRAEGALGDIGPKAKAAVPALILAVSAGTDINGVWALGRIGPDARAALPVLESKMRQETGRERVYAAGAVWAIGGKKAEAKAVVEKALEDQDQHIRIDAKNVLTENPDIASR